MIQKPKDLSNSQLLDILVIDLSDDLANRFHSTLPLSKFL